jgi:hypothetical protein
MRSSRVCLSNMTAASSQQVSRSVWKRRFEDSLTQFTAHVSQVAVNTRGKKRLLLYSLPGKKRQRLTRTNNGTKHAAKGASKKKSQSAIDESGGNAADRHLTSSRDSYPDARTRGGESCGYVTSAD